MLLKKDMLDFLHKDRIKNINIINFIENNPINYMEKVGDSGIVKGRSDENWVYISSSSQEELKILLEKCKEDEFFVVMDDWMLPIIIDNREIEWKLSCMKLIFPEETMISHCKYEIRELKTDDAEYIYHNSKYKDYTSIQYITDRIERGIALGIYDKEKLTAWIMTHDDGAIGFLNVLPEYRKKGYGYDLTIGIIDRLRKLNKIPFVHIEADNYKSMNLALKTGFIKAGNIHWVKRKNKESYIFEDDKIKKSLKLSYDERVDYRENREIQSWKLCEIYKILDYVKKEEKVNLLDLGSGPGKQGRMFKDNGIEVICVDISEEMIKACKTRGLEAYTMDFYNLTFPDESFDVVWSMNTLLHVPKNSIDKVLENIKRVLKPNGVFYLGIYGGYDFEGIWQDDFYSPKRFFSFYDDEIIKEVVAKHFNIIESSIIPIDDNKVHYQSLILRK